MHLDRGSFIMAKGKSRNSWKGGGWYTFYNIQCDWHALPMLQSPDFTIPSFLALALENILCRHDMKLEFLFFNQNIKCKLKRTLSWLKNNQSIGRSKTTMNKTIYSSIIFMMNQTVKLTNRCFTGRKGGPLCATSKRYLVAFHGYINTYQ